MSKTSGVQGFLPLATVDAMVADALAWLPRSPEYKAGVAYIMRRRLANIPPAAQPYRAGTVQFDAWQAGTRHGHDLVRDIREGVAQ